ncbi:MAG: hypothetical protein ACYC55_07660 [Candidatus Geothermincolia bacterium]
MRVSGHRSPWRGRFAVYAGLALSATGALGLPWVRVSWSRDLFVLTTRVQRDFALTDNAWLAATALTVLVMIAFLAHVPRMRGWGEMAGGLACVGVIAIYGYGLATEAFEVLGILGDLTSSLGQLGLPADEVRDFLLRGVGVSPGSGFMVWCAGTALILAGGIMNVRCYGRPEYQQQASRSNSSSPSR